MARRYNSLTNWVRPTDGGSVQIVRVTNSNAYPMTRRDGTVETLYGLFVRIGSNTPLDFDPTKALFATSDMVANLAAIHGIRISGDTASARRFDEVKHAWKEWVDLPTMLKHKYLGATAPTMEAIVKAHQRYHEILVELEADSN